MRRKHYTPFLTIAICLSALWIAALAPAKMHSIKISGGLCQTTGGPKMVGVPGFPGEKIDRRILPDLKKLIRKYKLFVVDGYSHDPAHAANGEHPMGLAVDLVPDFAHGGNWNLIDKLAKKAEPRQNVPRAPYRWVGYDGDAGHGRGNHLHLSWSHSELTGKRQFPKTVISKHCPKRGGGSTGEPDGGGNNGGGGNTGGGNNTGGGGNNHSGGGNNGGGTGSPSGGVGAGGGKGGGKDNSGGGKGGHGTGGSGGISPKRMTVPLAPPHPETAAESISG